MTARAVRILVALALGIGLFMIALGVARAAELDGPGPRWQLWSASPGGDWRPHVGKSGKPAPLLSSATACNLDVVSEAMAAPSGTAMACRRIDARQVAR